VFFRVKWFFFREQISVIRRYYVNPRFVLVDLTYNFINLFWNPYRACRKFLQKQGEKDVHVYGETPLTTFEKLMNAVGLCRDDKYVELGSGRGKTCVWAGLFRGCKVRGVEWMPEFVRVSSLCAKIAGKHVRFEQTNMLTVDLSDATVVYFYGIHMDAELLDNTFAQLKPGSRLITISEPINHEHFQITQVLPVRFPWGETEAYVHTKKLSP